MFALPLSLCVPQAIQDTSSGRCADRAVQSPRSRDKIEPEDRMTPTASVRSLAVLTVLVAALTGGCGAAPDDSPTEQIQDQLVGTWLREYQDEATVVRRILVLEPGGSFLEKSTVTNGETVVAGHEGEGVWLFDGTNLKRHYRRMDGRAPSAPIVPFATFAVRFSSHNEFVGVDNVHKIEVRYRRVADGTVP
jgi:hypothetical protein